MIRLHHQFTGACPPFDILVREARRLPAIPLWGGTTSNNNEHNTNQKPIVVIDGPNVACEYSGSRPGDARGIVAAYQFWKGKGHDVAIFIKKHRLHNERNPKVLLENVEELLKEIPKKSLTSVPAKEDDDSYMIEYCMSRQAIVVTNDQFKDHEEKYQGDGQKQFVEWRKTHRCGYAFALGDFLPSPSFEIPIMGAKKSLHSDKPQPKAAAKNTPQSKQRIQTKTKNSIKNSADSSLLIRGFNTSVKKGQPSLRLPAQPLELSKIINFIESYRGSKNTWKEIKDDCKAKMPTFSIKRVDATFFFIAEATNTAQDAIDWLNYPTTDNIPSLLEHHSSAMLSERRFDYIRNKYTTQEIQSRVSEYFQLTQGNFQSQTEDDMTTESAISVVLDIMAIPTEFRGRSGAYWKKFVRGLIRKPTLFEIKYSLLSTRFLEQTGYKLKSFYSNFDKFRAEFSHYHSKLSAEPMVDSDTFIIRAV